MKPAAELIAEGRAAAPPLGRTAFLEQHGVATESQWKRRCRDSGRLMYHMHTGLTTWEATATALAEVHAALAETGHAVDRFGLALDRAMGLPEADRVHALKETGPRLGPADWVRLGRAAPIQPHMGDHMIGFPAGFENTLHALSAGVTTIGNIGQFLAFDLLGGSDETAVTEATVRALGALSAHRDAGVFAHSNLCDSPAVQTSHYGAYLGWAALEQYAVRDLIDVPLAHCYGNMVHEPLSRAVVHFALDELRDRDSLGSMVYGNTVGYAPNARARNTAALAHQVLTDIALQLRRPTGHAINPVPLTEADRIPSAAEIVEAHLLARELEVEARTSGAVFDWARLERLGVRAAEYARTFRDRALASLAATGVDVTDAAQLFLALRRAGAVEIERRVALDPPAAIAALEPWKAIHVRGVVDRLTRDLPDLAGTRVVLGVLEVHDVIRDALARALPQSGCEVVVLPAGASVAGVARAAVDEDADAIVLAVYNGNALELGRALRAAVIAERFAGSIFFGGLLNQDTGGDLPVDVRPELADLGIVTIDRVDDLAPALARLRAA